MMNLQIYNTIHKTKETFTPITPEHVGLYVCGPTVYSEAHVGNVRTFMAFDIVYRYLLHLGYKVRYVRNITDVGHLTDDGDNGDDKIEKKARLEALEPMEIVQKYTNDFHKTCALFNLLEPSIEPTAIAHISEQIALIEKILANGLAYEVNGSVYFDIKKYTQKHEYGNLSGKKLDDLLEKTRDELEGSNEKKYFADFALWKKAGESTIMKWPSPWGEGVPGWHLECSAMSTKYLGKRFDIHGGGMDLKFPHHECEIAQSVGADGIDPVNYWMHVNMLTVNGTKMSKSLNNAFSPSQLISGDHPVLDKGYDPMTVRFFLLQSHYRSTVDFSNQALQAAEKGLTRLLSVFDTFKKISPSDKSTFDIQSIIDSSYQHINDDFNTPLCMASLFDGIKILNKTADGKEQLSAKDLLKLEKHYNNFIIDILGIDFKEDSNKNDQTENLMEIILDIRKQAKNNKDWDTADFIRTKLQELNISIKDTKDATSWEIK